MEDVIEIKPLNDSNSMQRTGYDQGSCKCI